MTTMMNNFGEGLSHSLEGLSHFPSLNEPVLQPGDLPINTDSISMSKLDQPLKFLTGNSTGMGNITAEETHARGEVQSKPCIDFVTRSTCTLKKNRKTCYHNSFYIGVLVNSLVQICFGSCQVMGELS